MHTVETLCNRIRRQPSAAYPSSPYWTPCGRIHCADGFSISVQAGEGIYSSPRKNYGPWTNVELGFPSAPLSADFAPYFDGPSGWATVDCNNVWGHVPIEMVVDLINSHGGEVAKQEAA
jgi:hypothetical protein